MPELPEVETTLHGVQPVLEGQRIATAEVRVPTLRLPTPQASEFEGRTFINFRRRNKYILADNDAGQSLILHLGMSGRLTLTTAASPVLKHDHILLTTIAGQQVRFHDPRRFGLVLLTPTTSLSNHPLLKDIGPEPLTTAFNGTYLHSALQAKSIPIKTAIMDGKLVAGVGNIYASESLFRAQLHPLKPANTLTKKQCTTLVGYIQETLADAIAAGGSSLRDFSHSEGQLGYFQHNFAVYGRKGQPCYVCQTPINAQVVNQRNTFWCPTCQRA
jgi:formamidopyrimidine-DNA glycosylase